MNTPVPFNWLETDQRTFDQVLRGLNWKKETETDFYILAHNRQRFATDAGGRFLVDPLHLISRLNK